MESRLSTSGKTALVTGSTSGIGLAIAQSLARHGFDVMLNGLGDQVQIEAARSALATETGQRIYYHPANMTSSQEIEDMVNVANEKLGSIDVLVNNAGIQHTAPIESFSPEMWDRIISINLTSAFHTTRLVLPGMKSRDWGRIINIASVHGLVASPFKSAYVAAKHGIVGLTKVTALEMAELNITANAICPGWVRTPLVEAQIKAKASEQGITEHEAAVNLLAEKQPNLRFAEAEEIGTMVLFLASNAARGVTGVALPIDGAWTAR